jgi:hypothetical protein
MTADEWANIRNFNPDTPGIGDSDKIRIEIMRPLDAFADWLAARGHRFVIHCAYEARETGYHPHGVAVDGHIPGMSVVDQYLAAERFDDFNGIGVYPDWNNPGLHIDARPKAFKLGGDARWGCIKMGDRRHYVALDADFFRRCLYSRRDI